MFRKNANKWFCALAVVLMLCMISAVMVGCGGGAQPGGNSTVLEEGPETGVYYYDVNQDEIVLSLNSGNKFSFAGPSYNKSGEYTVNGSEITFDFAKDEDGTATATIENDTLKVNLDGKTLTFLKKVLYTVKYDTAGGSSIEDASVVNGKLALKPGDPVRDGFVFIGWYADASYKTAYDFSTAVTENTTIYARWAEKTVGQAEYLASFVLGYEGAPEIEPMPTIGGKLYGVPTPTRDNYNFVGWFISMYEDGDKLTEKLTDSTVLDANTTLFAVWAAKDSEKLASPAVTVTDSSIKWDPVNGAVSYTVKVKSPDGTEIFNKANIGETTVAMNFSSLAAGDYTVEVIAAASNSEKNSDATVRYYKNKALGRVSNFQVVNGIFIFTAVENAEKYLITVDCGNKNHEHTLFDNGSSTTYNFTNCPMQEGGIKFTVTAEAAGYASSVSETFVYEKKLSAVSGIAYNKGTDSFVWDFVADAAQYRIELTTADGTFTFTTVANSFSLADYTGNVTIKVTPVTDGYISPAATEANCNKTAPAAPTELTVNGTTVTWKGGDVAQYEVRIGEQTFTVTTNSFDLQTSGINFEAGKVYDITVRAINNGEASKYSKPVTVGYFKLDTSLTYSENTVSWSPILGCKNFEVRVNGGEVITVSDKNSAPIVFTKAGINLIEVRCTDLEKPEWVSLEVTAYEVTYMTRSMAGDITEYVALGDTLSIPANLTYAGYTFGGWYNVPGAAAANGKEFTDTVFTGNGSLTLFAYWIANEYDITLGVDSDIVANIPEGTTQKVTFNSAFTLPVPEPTDDVIGFFRGWYTEPDGAGKLVADAEGKSVGVYTFTDNVTLYPYFDADTDLLTYVLLEDGTYGVKAGSKISTVAKIKIPAKYKGVAVTQILENGFKNCTSLTTITFPDTLTHIGVSAFEGCSKLTAFASYAGAEGTYEKFYYALGDALIYEDKASSNIYLENFPMAKTGEFTVPENITTIRPFAFDQSSISKVVISKNVTYLAESAFYSCRNLETIEFEYGRSAAVTIDNGAFNSLSKVHTLKLPALITAFDSSMTCLNSLNSLTTLLVEEGSLVYTSVSNLLCDANPAGLTILYIPRTFHGEFAVPEGISGIGDNLFKNNVSITSLVIPTSVSHIGANAFANCALLTALTVEGPRNGPLTIGDAAFKGSGLTSVEFLGSNAKALGEITVGASAFENCTSLTSFTVGANVNIASLGNNALKGNSKLTGINVHEDATLKSIGNNVFENCTGLKEFTVHASTEYIGNYAFKGCTELVTFTFSESEEPVSFGNSVFNNCRVLKTIKLPATLESFDGSVFEGCLSIQSIEVADGNPNLYSEGGVLYNRIKNSTMLELAYYPKAMDGDLTKLPWDKIEKISSAVFKDNQSVKTLVIGPNVVEIGDEAFANCTGLTSVSFDSTKTNKLEKIGNGAFNNCLYLTSVTLPGSVKSIGNEAFNSTKITAFTIPASVTTIGSGTFANTKIASITIPASVTSIGNGAFYNVSTLTTLNFDKRTEGLTIGTASAASGNGVFEKTKITKIDLPASVTYIGAYAFANISSASLAVTVPESSVLTDIGAYAFYNSKVSSFVFGNSVSTIGASAFEGTSLTSANFPASLTLIGENAFKISTLSSVSFKNGNEGLELVIKNGAFANTTFSAITLPSHLKAIGEHDEIHDYYTVDQIFQGNSKLSAINVDPANTTFCSIDGILCRYSTSGVNTEIMFCPSAKTGNVTVPTSVTRVYPKAFYNTLLTGIVFEEFDKNDANYGKPLLTIGSSSHKDSNYVVIGSYQINVSKNLTLIKFPSHLDVVHSYAVHQVGNTQNPQTEIIFNQDAVNGVDFDMYAIYNNPGLKKLILPKVKTTGSYTFASNTNLAELDLPVNSPVLDLAESSFRNLSKITSFTVPENVTSISANAFDGCGLTSIEFAGDDLQYIGKQAFAYCKFTSFTFPDSVTTIGASLFITNNGTNTTLKTLVLPDSLTSLSDSGTESFAAGCAALENIVISDNHPNFKVVDGILYDRNGTTIYLAPAGKTYDQMLVIPEGVTTIEVAAFYNFKGALIKLPNTLKTIKDRAFYDSALEMLIIPASVETIGSYAFSRNGGQTALTSIAFSGGSRLKTIGQYAFSYSGIQSIDIPNGVTSIGTKAFAFSQIASLTIPGSLKTIEANAFEGCSKLANLVIEEGVTTINARAFVNCRAFTTLNIPASVTSIGDYAFSNNNGNNSSLLTIKFAEGSRISSIGTQAFGKHNNLQTVIFNGNQLRSLGNKLFNGCMALEYVVLPSAMTSITADLFADCVELTTVVLPEKLTSIGNNAFKNCSSLTEITIPASVTSIGSAAFSGCTSLAKVTFADGSKVKSIPNDAFNGTTALTTINLPTTVTSFGNNAFKNSAVSGISFTNVTSVGTDAFNGCSGLTSVVFSNAIRTIGARAFANCDNIENLSLSVGLTTIGELAFENCVKIKEVSLPATLTSMSGNPFTNCTGITSFTVDSGNTSYIYQNGALFDKNMYTLIYYSSANTAESYELPSTVHEILGGAFAGSALKTFTIPNTANITSIPDNAFKNSKNLEVVVIPATITSIGNSAFEGCGKLSAIIIPSSIKTIGDRAFANCASLATVTVDERTVGFTSVGTELFLNCTSLTQVVDFMGINKFTANMYEGTGIVNLVIPASITDLSSVGVFKNCASLASVTFHSGVKSSIGKEFFYGCSALRTVSIPTTIGSIGEKAFMNSGLTSVILEGETFGFGASSFEGCAQLTTVQFNVAPNAVNVNSRAFANCTALTSTDFIARVNGLSSEAFLNCSSLTGVLNHKSRDIILGNNVFAGTNFTEIHFIAMDINIEGNYGLSGLSAETTVYFDGMTETNARHLATMIENTEATVVFKTSGGGSGTTSDKLTEKEIAGIQKLTSENKEFMGMEDKFQAALIEYKKMGYLDTGKISPEISKDEIVLIDNFLKTIEADPGRWSEVFQKKLQDYKKYLIENPPATPELPFNQTLTEKELAGIERLIAESGKELGDITEALKKALLEYKKAGHLDNITSAELSKEEIALIDEFCRNNIQKEFYEHWVQEFQKRLQEYKKYLMENPPVNPDPEPELPFNQTLTEKELAGIERLIAESGKELGDITEALKKALLEYKKAGYLDNITSAELSKEEIALIDEFCRNNIQKEFYEHWFNEFQKRLQSYKKYLIENPPVNPDPEPTVELTDKEIEGIKQLVTEFGKEFGGLTAEKFQEAMLAYKKLGYLDNLTSAEVTKAEIELIKNFVAENGIDMGWVERFQQKLQAYKEALIKAAEPTVELTDKEIEGIKQLVTEFGKEFGGLTAEKFQEAMLSYKKMGYLDNLTSAEVTKAEIELIKNFVAENGIDMGWVERFQQKLQTYKELLLKAQGR